MNADFTIKDYLTSKNYDGFLFLENIPPQIAKNYGFQVNMHSQVIAPFDWTMWQFCNKIIEIAEMMNVNYKFFFLTGIPNPIEELNSRPKEYKTEAQWKKDGYEIKKDAKAELFIKVCADGHPYISRNNNPGIYPYLSKESVQKKQKKSQDIKESDKKISGNHVKNMLLDIIARAIKREKILKHDNKSGIIVFDTETTGFSVNDEIIQITMYDGNGKELMNSFIKPYLKTSWDEAEKVNHISPEMVENAPYAHEIAPYIIDAFKSATKVIGHNVEFDVRMVKQCFGYDFEGKEIIDTLKIFKEEKPKGTHKLRDAISYYCPEMLEMYDDGAHKSDTDAIATLAVYRAMENEKIKAQEIEK